MKLKFLALPVAAVLAIPQPVYAHGKEVYDPYVEEGIIELEAKNTYVLDDDNGAEDGWSSEIVGVYGVTSFWEAELGFLLEDEGRGEDTEVAAFVFENKFQLARPGTFFVDPGLKIQYARSLTGTADEIAAKLLLAKEIGQFSTVANFGMGREIGEDSSDENEYSFAFSTAYPVAEHLSIGAEWYSDFGNFEDDFDDESHQVGPVLYGETLGLEYEFGVLAGVSEAAPNAEAKLILGYEF